MRRAAARRLLTLLQRKHCMPLSQGQATGPRARMRALDSWSMRRCASCSPDRQSCGSIWRKAAGHGDEGARQARPTGVKSVQDLIGLVTAGCARPLAGPRCLRACQAQDGASRTAREPDAMLVSSHDGFEQSFNILKLLDNPVGNGVTVAQQTLTLFVLVRIQVPQPNVTH